MFSFGKFTSLFLPSEIGITELEKKSLLLDRKSFSNFLPYKSFDPKTNIFTNKDGSKGFIFICSPFWNENYSARTIFSAIIKDLPNKGILSAHLISLDYIDPILQHYIQLKQVRKNPIIQKTSQLFADYIKECVHKGTPHLLGTNIKNFVLLLCFKFHNKTEDWLINYKIAVEQQLKGCGFYPIFVNDFYMLNLMYNMFNSQWLNLTPNPNKTLSSQMLMPDTDVEVKWDHLTIGKKKWMCVSPKNLPKEYFDPYVIGEIVGPSNGAVSDGRQIRSHFMFSVIVYRDEKLHGELFKKTSLFFNQLKGDANKSIIGQLIGEYAVEHSQAIEDIEKGDKFFYVFPFFWTWDFDYKRVKQSAQQIRNLFEEHGFPAQEERGILSILFLSSLPFGFNLSTTEINTLDRHFVCKEDGAAGMLPLVGDISGFGDPACLYVSRKGQIVTFDPFCKDATNKNCVVMGTTGGGKSVNMNMLIYSMYANGAMVRIIDLGYSYLKQCKLFNGEYIDFSADKPICLNPFSFINEEDTEDLYRSFDLIAELLLSMAFEGSQERITKEHIALIHSAVQWGWREWGKEADLDQIYAYLTEFPALAGDEIGQICENEQTCLPDLKKEAQKLGFSLRKWTSAGPFGKWFNGKSTIDLVSSDYLVLEMEKLKRITSLLRVVTLAVMNAVTSTFYLTNKNIKKIFLIEECGIILKDVPGLKGIIQEAYRRIRKYNGAAITVFQSPMDIQDLGETGRVMLGNSAYWFMLPSDQYANAKKEKIIDIDDYMLKVLQSIKLTAPRYGEIGLKTPFGFGVVRTILNGFFYYLVTTDPTDWQMIVDEAKAREKKYKKQGIKNANAKAFLDVMEEYGRKRDIDFYEKFGKQK